MHNSKFIFVVCQIGAEPALKEELSVHHPELKFSYSRPGFLTFVCTKGELASDFRLRSIFARAYGLTLKRSSQDKLREEITALGLEKAHLHVFESDRFFPGDEPLGFSVGGRAAEVEAALRHSLQDSPLRESQPGGGSTVLDIIGVEITKRGSPPQMEWWIGVHTHHDGHSNFSGGRPPIELPHLAPSRAYLKFTEALLKSGAQMSAEHTAIEIGCTPGGTLFALLERGLRVFGVDPNPVSPLLAERFGEHFTFIERPMEFFKPTDSLAPKRLDWLLLDVNVSPDQALPVVAEWVRHHQKTLKGAFLTLKLMNWDQRLKIPKWIEQIQRMGLEPKMVTQLAYNRQEILVFATP